MGDSVADILCEIGLEHVVHLERRQPLPC
ncbi:MAG: hypothetical protein ACLURV_02205 [Gallintestinimicrobium sp.]